MHARIFLTVIDDAAGQGFALEDLRNGPVAAEMKAFRDLLRRHLLFNEQSENLFDHCGFFRDDHKGRGLFVVAVTIGGSAAAHPLAGGDPRLPSAFELFHDLIAVKLCQCRKEHQQEFSLGVFFVDPAIVLGH